MSRIYKKQKQLSKFALVLVIGVTVAFRLLLPRWVNFAPWHWFAYYFVSVNLVTWLVFFYDKRIAGREGVVRVPENILFMLAVAGGLPSTLIAMHVLRHKRAKLAFKWKLFAWFIVVYGVIGACYWLLGDDIRKLVA